MKNLTIKYEDGMLIIDYKGNTIMSCNTKENGLVVSNLNDKEDNVFLHTSVAKEIELEDDEELEIKQDGLSNSNLIVAINKNFTTTGMYIISGIHSTILSWSPEHLKKLYFINGVVHQNYG